MAEADDQAPGLIERIRQGWSTRRFARATVDRVAPPPSPLQPIDLADDAAVTEVLRVALWIGEVLLASGTAAIDTETQVGQIAAAYGLYNTDVNTTYDSIAISALRGENLPPIGAIRIVKSRAHDFTRISQADRLVRTILRGGIDPAEALDQIGRISESPHAYPRWVATLGWAGLAGAIAALLGAGALVTLVAFATTVVIDRVNIFLGRIGLPAFFQQVVGGFIATVPAAVLYALRSQLDISVRPSLIIAAGVIVLLSGLSLVGSVQDAITGAPITGVGRFFELLVMTGGIIAGVALGLRAAAALGYPLPAIAPAQYTGDLTALPIQVTAGAVAATAYAVACYAQTRALLVSALAGAVGITIFVVAGYLGAGVVVAAGAAAAVVGLAGGLLARLALTPPMIVDMSGITPLLPGLAIYRGLYAMLNEDPVTGMSHMGSALTIGAALASGVVLGEWVARLLRRPRMLSGAPIPIRIPALPTRRPRLPHLRPPRPPQGPTTPPATPTPPA